MIGVLKTMRGLDRIDREKLFPLMKKPKTTGHRFKVISKRSKRIRGETFLSNEWLGSGIVCLRISWRQVQSKHSKDCYLKRRNVQGNWEMTGEWSASAL